MENRQITEWNGYRKIAFTVGGRESFVIVPETAAPGNPWVWRCEFFGAFDTADRALLEKGWHLAYHRVSDMYGCPASLPLMHEFQTVVCEELHLSRQAVLFGFSRGGLYAVNYAEKYPYEVAALYLDAPVTDIASWPCGSGGNEKNARECLNLYGLTRENVLKFTENPNNKAFRIAEERIPVMIVAGGADRTVPWEENGKIFAEQMRAAGGIVDTIVKPTCDHHPHSLDDPAPIVEFLLSHTDFAPRLPNTLCRLTKEKKLTVGYFGGSITEGGGENGWRGRNNAWLRKQFPEAEITQIQAAIGGTGTALGVFRCEQDLLSKKPDLVYVEFAVNDYGDWQNTSVNTESILRRIRQTAPTTEIVLVFTMTKNSRDGMDLRDEPYRSRDLQMRLARHYNIPTVNIGDALWRAVKHQNGGDWTALAPDTVHPNADGYAYCAAEMQSFMETALSGESGEITLLPLPAPLNGALRENARLEDAALAHREGFTPVETSLCGRYPRYIEGTAGSSLTLEFFGDTVGLYWMMAKDSGDIEYSVDGGEWKSRSSWDHYCLRFNRANSTILAAGLEPKMHTLQLRVREEHNPQSEGTAVRIGAFLVN